MSKYCQCDQPRIENREGEELCLNCGKSEFRQFHKKSEGGQYTGSVQVSARGYFIIISDDEAGVSHQLKQREVRAYENKFGITGQVLADFLASKCTGVRYSYNGKYGNSSASFDFRSKEKKKMKS